MRLSTSHRALVPEAYQGLLKASHHLHKGTLEPALVHLVEIRVSQLNGCAFCLDMHTTEALEAGESARKLAVLAAWRDAPFFSGRERTALAWAEALTELGRHGATDELAEAVKAEFGEQGFAELSYVAAVMNAWNRLGVGFRLDLPQAAPAAAEVGA